MFFQSENFSNWVIGPELGKFIAGIRNDDTSVCVHGVEKPWKYASRAGVWKQDDSSLGMVSNKMSIIAIYGHKH